MRDGAPLQEEHAGGAGKTQQQAGDRVGEVVLAEVDHREAHRERMRGVAARLLPLYPLTVSFAVVYLGEHYLADAVAGLLLGLAGTACVLLLQRRGIAHERRAASFAATASDPQAA